MIFHVGCPCSKINRPQYWTTLRWCWSSFAPCCWQMAPKLRNFSRMSVLSSLGFFRTKGHWLVNWWKWVNMIWSIELMVGHGWRTKHGPKSAFFECPNAEIVRQFAPVWHGEGSCKFMTVHTVYAKNPLAPRMLCNNKLQLQVVDKLTNCNLNWGRVFFHK